MEFVKIETGEIQGREFEHGCVFLGIPYAAAPVGDLRWAPPAPADSWNGVLDCTHPKNRCYQAFPPEAQRVDTSVPVEERTTVDYVREFHSSPAFPDAPESEDALTLNIWTPAKTSEDGLSVAVWIHGGAFVNGSGLEMEFDGVEYAKRGVILVTVNYRLGLMGFFSHPDLRRETEKYGNYGLQDQLAALNWVKRNIRVFGGDPDKVTLFGQSAGCVSTMYQLCAGESRGLFHQVILQSGGGYNSHFVDLSVKADFAAQAGLEFGKRYFNTEKIEDLRRVSASELRSCLLQEQKKIQGFAPFIMPTIGGCLLPRTPNDSIASGSFAKLPSVIGSTSQDMSPEEMRKGSANWAIQMEKLGAPPAYVYEFSHQPLGDRVGAFHSSELWYMFGTIDRSWRPMETCDYELSQEMLDRWCAFIRTGSPNTANLPEWKTYTSSAPETMYFCRRPRL